MKAIATKTNSKGKTFALTVDNGTYGVWALCETYSRHVKGGISKSWRYVEKGVSLEQAEKTFKRRTK